MRNKLIDQKVLVISAVGIRDGGALEVLRACSESAKRLALNNWRVVVLVGQASLLKASPHFELLEFPKAKKSWGSRLYHEWFLFYWLSKKLKPDLWVSLHDITPIVYCGRQVVYCHNPSPFYFPKFREIYFDPKLLIFSCVYKWVYSIRQSRNYYVIVQQEWIREKFLELFNTKRVIVAHPRLSQMQQNKLRRPLPALDSPRTIFFYPALPRVFKNFETIIKAVKVINQLGLSNFEVRFTFLASESRYTQYLAKLIGDSRNISLLGRLDRSEIRVEYESSDVVLFPSKLETWGLPISEAKVFGREILAADLPYAYEAVSDYGLVSFIDAENPYEWAKAMIGCINKTWVHSGCTKQNDIPYPFAKTWDDLWPILIDGI